MGSVVPNETLPNDTEAIPAPDKVSATAKRAAARNRRGKKKQGRNRRGPMVDENRIEMVIRLLDSWEEPPYIQRVVARHFKCGERTVRDDIARVLAERESEREPDAYQERIAHRRGLLAQVKECLRSGNKSEARRFWDMLIRIGGHYAPDAVKVMELRQESLKELTDDELARMEEELYRQYGPVTRRPQPQPQVDDAQTEAAGNAAAVRSTGPGETGHGKPVGDQEETQESGGAKGEEGAREDTGTEG